MQVVSCQTMWGSRGDAFLTVGGGSGRFFTDLKTLTSPN